MSKYSWAKALAPGHMGMGLLPGPRAWPMEGIWEVLEEEMDQFPIGVRWGISRHPPMAKVPGEPPATKEYPFQSRIPWLLGTMDFPQTKS